MKTLSITCIVIAGFLACISPTETRSQSLGIGLGLSTPNDAINSVYNSDVIEGSGSVGNFLREASELGYNIGARYYLPMGDDLTLAFGVSYHRFPETDIRVVNPQTNEEIAVLRTEQNVVPISAGFEFPFFRQVLGVYVAADLHYNLFFNSVSIVRNDIALPFDTSPSYSRAGASIGAGVDFDLSLFTLDLGLKYNHANLIGKETDEPNKTFVTLNVMIIFGQKSKGSSD